MDHQRQIVIAEGPLRRLEELQRILATESIQAEVLRPPGGVGNG